MQANSSVEALLTPCKDGGIDRSFHWLVAVISTFYVFIHLYLGFYGSPDSQLLNALHVNSALALVFMTRPAVENDHRLHRPLRWLDAAAVLGCLWCTIYFLNEIETWSMRTLIFRPVDYFTSVLFIALILEATRRAVGLVLVVICVVLMLYAMNSDHFAGMFYGAPVTPTRLLQTVFLGSAGIFGVAVSVMTQYVVLFILFGVLLNAVGGGRFFTKMAFALFGHRRGGPAKAAVVSSAMLGTLSGSAIGNVVTTGIFTIPLMIRLGYRRAFAGGVEAAASNAGMISPPIMGAVAFIMADLMGVSYLSIIMAAAVPALLYYAVMFVTVDLEARKLGISPLPRAKIPPALPMLMREGYFLAPLIVICVALAMGMSVIVVAVLTIVTTVIIGVVRRTDRLNPVRMFEAVEETARATAGLSATAAAAGIMLGAIFAVGLSYQVAQEAARVADGQLWALVLLCGVMAIIMGMGMSAAAVYLTLAATIIPIMQVAGISQMAAHFFAFYFGIASNITPPVALTAYAAAPIAGSKPVETGVYAAKLGMANLLLPVLFIYHPAILLEGSIFEIVTVSFTCLIALCGFAVATTGYLFRIMSGFERLASAGVAALLFVPEAMTDVVGLVLTVAGVYFLWRTRSKTPRTSSTVEDAAHEMRDTGWLARWANSRMKKEEAAAILPDTDPSDEDSLLRSLFEEPAADTRPVRAEGALASAATWIVVFSVAAIFHYAGSNYLHARSPELWTAVMALAAVLFVTGITLAVRGLGAPVRRPA